LHLAATFVFTNALRKNSCIGNKCRKDVQKFTPAKISGGFRIFGGGEFPPAICLEETLGMSVHISRYGRKSGETEETME